jgi:hypothetical protein
MGYRAPTRSDLEHHTEMVYRHLYRTRMARCAVMTVVWVCAAMCLLFALGTITGCGGARPTEAQVDTVITEVERIACTERGLQIIHTSDTCQIALERLTNLVITFPACAHVFGEHSIQLVCDAPKKEGFYDEVRTWSQGDEGCTRVGGCRLPHGSDIPFRRREARSSHGGNGPTWVGGS